MILVSACIAGFKCKYDGTTRPNEKVIELVRQGKAIPACPEILAGLPTPRPAVEIKGGRIITKEEKDLTHLYQLGARKVLDVCKLYRITKAILKERSPSCGCNFIYDGTFSNKIIKGKGVLAELLAKNNIGAVSEEEI